MSYYSGSYGTSSLNSGLSNEKEKEYYKKFYRTLATKFHPDVTGDNEAMQFLNKLKESWGFRSSWFKQSGLKVKEK